MRAKALKKRQKIQRKILNHMEKRLCMSFAEISELFATKPSITDDHVRAALAWLAKQDRLASDDGLWYLTRAHARAYRARVLPPPPLGEGRER